MKKRQQRLLPPQRRRRRGYDPGPMDPDAPLIPIALASPHRFAGSRVDLIFESKPVQQTFRPERLLMTTTRSGRSAYAKCRAVLGLIYVGLQAAGVEALPLELIGSPSAFGCRLMLPMCKKGETIRVRAWIGRPLLHGDTIEPVIMMLGRVPNLVVGKPPV